MKRFILFYLISSLVLTTASPQEIPEGNRNHHLGEGADQGSTSASTIAWTAIGVSFIVAIGIIIAVTIHRDHN